MAMSLALSSVRLDGFRQGSPATIPASFSATLLSSLVPEVYTGSSTPTMTRATTAYVTDFEGLLKQVPSGCARLGGARFVRNLWYATAESLIGWSTTSGTLGSGVSDPVGGTNAFTFTATGAGGRLESPIIAVADAGSRSFVTSCWMRRRTGTGTVLMLCPDASTSTDITASITSTWKRFASSVTSGYGPSNNVSSWLPRLMTSGDAVDVYHPMIEEVSGQANQVPSEFLGTLAAPYHGAGVDGCKYFTTQNGNTVASNVVTEATGAAISSATLLGYQAEGARTNPVLQSQTFGAGDWFKTGLAVTADQYTAPDGTTTMDKLTASAGAGNHYIYAVVSMGSTNNTNSFYVKYVNHRWVAVWLNDSINDKYASFDLLNGVVGAVTAGATSRIELVSAGVYRISVSFAGASGSGRTMLSMNNTDTASAESWTAAGTEIVGIWGGQNDNGLFPSSYIPTTTVAVARNGDVLSYVTASNLDLTTGTAYAEYQAAGFPGNQGIIGGLAGNLRVLMCDNATTCWMYDGVSLPTTGAGTSALNNTVKVAGAWGGAGMYIDRSGSTTATSAFDGSLESAASFGIGQNVGNQLFGNVRNVSIWTIKKTQAEVEALVA